MFSKRQPYVLTNTNKSSDFLINYHVKSKRPVAFKTRNQRVITFRNNSVCKTNGIL